MFWSTSELRVRLASLNWFKPSCKIFYWPFKGGTSFVDLLCFCSALCLLCLCVRLFICALWSPAGKGLTSWLWFVVSNCKFITFHLVFWVRCGTWLYRFMTFAPLLTFIQPLTPIMVIFIDRTSIRFSDGGFRKTINASNKIYICSLKKLCRENISLFSQHQYSFL